MIGISKAGKIIRQIQFILFFIHFYNYLYFTRIILNYNKIDFFHRYKSFNMFNFEKLNRMVIEEHEDWASLKFQE